MGNPTTREAQEIKQVLLEFTKASSTSINQGKSYILFLNTPIAIQTNLARILGYHIGALPSKYLGAPLVANSLKKASWEELLTRMKNKLECWTFFISQPAKKTSVSQICSSNYVDVHVFFPCSPKVHI
jgi:hypothetical protein